MDITKYSKKMWITVLVLAGISIILDILSLTKVVDLWDDSTAKVSIVIGLLAVYYAVRGVMYHVKKDKEQK